MPNRKKRIGLFLMIDAPLTGGGGAERQFSDVFDAFQERICELEVWLVTDAVTYRFLKEIGRPRFKDRLKVLKTLGDVRVRPRRKVQSFLAAPWEWCGEGLAKCGRRIEWAGLVVQSLWAALQFDLIHFPMVRPYQLYFLRLLRRVPKRWRPRLSISVVDCRLGPALASPKWAGPHTEIMLDAFRACPPDGILTWYEEFQRQAERVKLFPNSPVLHAARYCFVPSKTVPVCREKDRIVVFAGRMEEIKKPFLFVEAVRLLLERYGDLAAQWKFEMYGRGPLENAVRDRLKEYGLVERVPLGWAPNMPEVFARTRLFVSTQDLENFSSLAMLEAMACGNAVVARDVGQTRRFVRDGVNGFLAHGDTPEAIADTIARYLAAPELHDRMQAESIRLAREEFTEENFLAEIEDYWLRVLAQPHEPRNRPAMFE